MGLFDSIAKRPAPVLQPVFSNSSEAFVAIMFCAINADGYIDDLETDAIAKTLSFKRSFQAHDVFGYYKNALALTNEHGCDDVMRAAAGLLSDEEKKAALVVTIDLLFANGVVNDKEQQFVDDLAAALNLDRAWARSAIDVIVLKYD
jgi:uncharacterized membrane protein YebE (DUF533 family)